ncbi:MAG: Ig-like domain-containing protein, partial [Muribaculaceae bacterium]|nr:Ig-like domain-containing protein [Muribaculaceae bacterium]
RFDIYFNENIQLEDPSTKIIVSPAQKLSPSITSQGRRVTVELRDSLLANTTYTIDFADAVNDLNEKNILDGFALDFSTGDTIDTLRISGMVLAAQNLEPAQGMLVGVYSNLADSAISTLPLERVARTNQLGQFTIRNLKAGTYRIFAINDANRDNHWDRSEDIAFYDMTISPTVEHIEVTDTLRSSTDQDSLVTRNGVKYLPNDILLTWFNENYQAQYLMDYKRPDRHRIFINFGAPSDTMPTLTILDGPLKGTTLAEHSVIKRSATRDSLEYWITDSAIIARDSLLIAASYLRTDTLDNLTWTTDTLKFNFRAPKSGKKKKKDDEADTIPEITFLAFNSRGTSVQDINKPLYFEASEPVSRFDSAAVHLLKLTDTVWTEIYARPVPEADSINPLSFKFDYEWEPGSKYKLSIDSAAITGIYGHWNRPILQEIKVRSTEEYGNLFFRINDTDSAAVVELLNQSDATIAAAPVIDGIASFRFVRPGTYYARLFLDSNRNGKWDTGNIADAIQPEETFYYPGKIALKANWDIEQSWNIYQTALDLQTPNDIQTHKPKHKNATGQPNKSVYDDEEDDDNFFNNGYQGTTTNRYDT